MILYIHGFLSSSKSLKAVQTINFMAQNHPEIKVLVPQLPPYPQDAIAMLEKLYQENQNVIKGIVGSSLGGYYATYLVEKYSVKSVLINPAVRPYELFEDHMGEQINPYTKQQFEVDLAYLNTLKTFDTKALKVPACYWLLQQQGDEVLDYTQAVTKYQGCQQTVESGGNHGFVGFERFLPQIAEFFELNK